METSGLDPKIMICKITVLPIKLCPLYNYISEERFERSRHVCQQSLNLHCLPIPALGLSYKKYMDYIIVIVILRPKWLEHLSKPSWAVCFTH
jgi:hypothetical protein